MDIADVVARTTTVLQPQEATSAPASLRQVLSVLGPTALVHRTGSDEQLDAPIGEPMILGAGEPVPALGDELLLLTGGRDLGGLPQALALAAAAGGRTVVVKSWGSDLVEAVRVADQLGLTLLVTADDTAWRQLDAVITAARTSTVSIRPGEEPGGDLFALANSIAASLGGPVTIEALTGRVWAYSNLPGQDIDEIRRLAILGRQTPERPTNTAEYRAVVRGPGPVHFESSDPAFADRLAVAIRAGHQVLGLIWVLCHRPGLVEDADRVLTDASRAAALHLLRARGSHDPGRARRAEALRGLLAGSGPVDEIATALGLSPTSSLVMATVRPAPGLGAETAQVTTAQVLDLVGLHGEYWHPGSTTMLDRGSIALALPTPDITTTRLAPRLRKLGTDLVTAARRSGGPALQVAIGPVTTLADASRSLRLAEQVADVLTGDQQVAMLDDVRSAVVLAAVDAGRPSDDDAPLLPQVCELLHHDRTQSTSYARTLLAHLSSFGDMAATAQALDVHENTARYRIRRLGELFGVDLTGGDETLVTWLQVRAACARPQGPAPT